MTINALSGLRVAELGDFIVAPYCTKLMGDLGSDVIKIESPRHGDSARKYGPFPHDDPHPEKSLLFAYLNSNKRGITLDIRSPDGLKIFKELLTQIDVLVESNQPRIMEDLGLDYPSLSRLNPSLIVTSITPFGQTGPYRDYKSTDLVSFHMGGIGYPTPGDVEDPDSHPPLNAPGHQAGLMAGVTGAAATMSAVLAREFTGRGQHVDISEQETLVRAQGRAVVSHVHKGETPTRIAGMGRPIATRKPIMAKDGYFTVQLLTDNFWESMKKILGYPDWADSELFTERQSRMDNQDAIMSMFEDWSKDYTRQELYQILQVENHIPYGQVNTVSETLAHPQWQERGTFIEMEHPHIGQFKAPATPFDFSGIPRNITRSAPALGQHNKEIICETLGYSSRDLVRLRQMGIV